MRNEQRKAITGKGRGEMKARKAALRLLISAMLVVGLLPVAALAADGEQVGDVKVPAQAQVEGSAQDQAQAGVGDQTQVADDQGRSLCRESGGDLDNGPGQPWCCELQLKQLASR